MEEQAAAATATAQQQQHHKQEHREEEMTGQVIPLLEVKAEICEGSSSERDGKDGGEEEGGGVGGPAESFVILCDGDSVDAAGKIVDEVNRDKVDKEKEGEGDSHDQYPLTSTPAAKKPGKRLR